MFQTIQRDAFDVIGIALRADNTDPAVGEKIGAHWQRFFAEGIPGKIAGRMDDAFVAVYTDYAGDHTRPYSLIVGCRVENEAIAGEGLVKIHVPAQAYAFMTARGSMPGAVVDAWQAIWSSDLKRSYTSDFEVYDHRAANPENAEVDIYTAILS